MKKIKAGIKVSTYLYYELKVTPEEYCKMRTGSDEYVKKRLKKENVKPIHENISIDSVIPATKKDLEELNDYLWIENS